MGYRLNIDELKEGSLENVYYGTKLYGYKEESNFISYKYLLTLGKIDDLKGEMVHNWIHKDKIKAKIKELNAIYNVNLKPMTDYELYYFMQSYIDKVKNILQDLLEE